MIFHTNSRYSAQTKEKEKDLKDRSCLDFEEVKMGIFGQGHGFLGLYKKYNWLVTLLSAIIAILGIAYFIRIGQAIS